MTYLILVIRIHSNLKLVGLDIGVRSFATLKVHFRKYLNSPRNIAVLFSLPLSRQSDKRMAVLFFIVSPKCRTLQKTIGGAARDGPGRGRGGVCH